jgi:Domain of unknown function (DUF5658)
MLTSGPVSISLHQLLCAANTSHAAGRLPMFSKIASSFVLIVLTATVPVMAADEAAPSVATAAGRIAEKAEVMPVSPLTVSGTTTRGSLLTSLYVSLAGLNAFDAYTTSKGIALGATESNGLMRGAAGSPAVMWAIKGGVTGGSILMSERLWRSGRRVEALATMVAANALMVAVGARNGAVLAGQR